MGNDRTRLKYIDYAKAIAIYLVVLGHASSLNLEVKRWLCVFHVPVFFALSGLLWKPRINSFSDAVCQTKKRVLRLLVPYAIWAVVYIIPDFKSIPLVLYGSRTSLKMANSVTSLWFLPCLFIAEILIEALLFVAQRAKSGIIQYIIQMIGLLLFGLIGLHYTYSNQPGIGFPFSLNIAFVAAFFILFGKLCYPAVRRLSSANTECILFVCIGSFLITLFCQQRNNVFITGKFVNVSCAIYGNSVLFILGGIVGMWFVLSAAMLIERVVPNRSLSLVGKNTLPILVLHRKLITSVTEYLSTTFGRVGCILPIVTLMIVAVTTIGGELLRKFVPWSIGESQR